MKNGRVLLVDADPALRGLIEEWLADADWQLVDERPDVLLVDLPGPREGCSSLLRRVSNAHPHAPVVALSSSFFDGIESHGAVARALGVASVLPKPLTRDALVAALRDSLRPE
jgi:DNA-binding response OmpR family regulator